MASQKILIRKGTPTVVDTSGACTVPIDKITSLSHKSFDDSVKGRMKITTLLLSSRRGLAFLKVVNKILDGFRDVLLVENQTEIQNPLAYANLEKSIFDHVV